MLSICLLLFQHHILTMGMRVWCNNKPLKFRDCSQSIWCVAKCRSIYFPLIAFLFRWCFVLSGVFTPPPPSPPPLSYTNASLNFSSLPHILHFLPAMNKFKEISPPSRYCNSACWIFAPLFYLSLGIFFPFIMQHCCTGKPEVGTSRAVRSKPDSPASTRILAT